MDDRRVLATFKIALGMFTLCTFAVAIFALATFVYLWIFLVHQTTTAGRSKISKSTTTFINTAKEAHYSTGNILRWNSSFSDVKMENVKMQSLLDPTSKANCSSTE